MDILTLSGFILAVVALVGGSILKGAGVKGLLGAAAFAAGLIRFRRQFS